MSDVKILKNTTGSAIDLNVLGLADIPAGGQVTIEIFDYILLGSDDSLAYLSPLITAGSIVVNNGLIDLVAADGIRYLRYPERATIQQNDVDVVQVNKVLNFEGADVTVVDEGDGKATIQIGEIAAEEQLHWANCVDSNGCFIITDVIPLIDFTLCPITDKDC